MRHPASASAIPFTPEDRSARQEIKLASKPHKITPFLEHEPVRCCAAISSLHGRGPGGERRFPPADAQPNHEGSESTPRLCRPRTGRP